MQNKVVGFVTVRTSSKRLPNKCLLRFGECTVIEHIIRRALKYNISPIICTSTDKSDDIFEKIALNEGVRIFRGSLVNKLKRWDNCADHFNIKSFHTIDADDPFFDGDEMISSMKILVESDLDLVYPSKISSDGGGSVGYSIKSELIKKAMVNISDDTDTEMMWFFLEKLQNIKAIQMASNPFTPEKIRLTLDYEEDYWLLESVCRMLGNYAPRRKIDELFKTNPDLYKINWFRNSEWKAAQIIKS